MVSGWAPFRIMSCAHDPVHASPDLLLAQLVGCVANGSAHHCAAQTTNDCTDWTTESTHRAADLCPLYCSGHTETGCSNGRRATPVTTGNHVYFIHVQITHIYLLESCGLKLHPEIRA